jgi:hypothetical protein
MATIGGLIRKTGSFFRRRWRKWLFWLLNGALLLLYGWTLTESVPIAVQVVDGRCVAILSDRTAEIPCPGLSEGEIGLYLERVEQQDLAETGPLDWFAPRAGWHRILVSGGEADVRPIEVTFLDELAYWRRVGDEWRPLLERAALRWRAPIRQSFMVEASVRRPEGELAGLLLLEAGGQAGWMFRVDTEDRQASWWRWEDGGPSEFLLGIPFQKPLLAQAKSLLRVILQGHHGALLVLFVGWLLSKGLRGRRLPELKPVRPFYGVCLVALLMLGATMFIAVDVLERVPHVQDSVTFLFQAELLAKGRLFAPAPELPQFFEQEFLTVRDGRWFGQYPPGFALLLAVGVVLKLPWLVNPLLATLTVVLIYRLGVLLFGRKEGLLAAVLALFSPYYLLMSGSFMVHPAELFWIVLFLVGWVNWLKGGGGRWGLVGAGAALGMVVLTRQVTAAAVGGAVVGVSLIAAVTGRFGLERFRIVKENVGWRKVLFGGVVVGLGIAPFLVLLLGYQWGVTGDPMQDPRLISRPFDRPGFGLDVGSYDNAFTTAVIEGETVVVWYTDPELPPRGHNLARGLFNTIQNWEALSEHLFGWLPFLTLAFCWLVFVTGRPSFGDWLLLGVMGAVVMVYVAYWAAGIMYGPRYYYAALPAFLLLTGRGVVMLGRRLGGRSGRWVAVGLAAAFVVGNLLFYLPETVEDSRGFNFVSGGPLAAVEEMIEGKAIVFVGGDEDSWWEYGQFFSGNTPWLDGRIVYARDLGEENGRLLDLYRGRAAYCWDGEVGALKEFPC